MRIRLLAALGWTILIAGLCWTPRAVVREVEEEAGFWLVPHFDKVVHLGMFAGFAFLWLAAARRPRYGAVALAGLAFAVATELGQLAPQVNRTADLDDAVFDLVGVALGSLAFRFATARRARKRDAASAPVATGAEAA